MELISLLLIEVCQDPNYRDVNMGSDLTGHHILHTSGNQMNTPRLKSNIFRNTQMGYLLYTICALGVKMSTASVKKKNNSNETCCIVHSCTQGKTQTNEGAVLLCWLSSSFHFNIKTQKPYSSPLVHPGLP